MNISGDVGNDVSSGRMIQCVTEGSIRPHKQPLAESLNIVTVLVGPITVHAETAN